MDDMKKEAEREARDGAVVPDGDAAPRPDDVVRQVRVTEQPERDDEVTLHRQAGVLGVDRVLDARTETPEDGAFDDGDGIAGR